MQIGQGGTRLKSNGKSIRDQGAAEVRVPGLPLKFDSKCWAPVLREPLGANRPNFLINFNILLNLTFFFGKSAE